MLADKSISLIQLTTWIVSSNSARMAWEMQIFKLIILFKFLFYSVLGMLIFFLTDNQHLGDFFQHFIQIGC